MMDKKKNILDNLKNNLPKVPDEPQPPTLVTQQHIVDDTEEDYNYARKKLKSLINKSEDAIDNLAGLTQETEHPRAFEVLSQMLKNTSDSVERLLDLQKKRKELTQEEAQPNTPAGTVTNNTVVFSGSASDLQRMFTDEQLNDAIPVDNDEEEEITTQPREE